MAIYKDVEPLEVMSYKCVNEDFDNGVKYVLEKLDALPTADAVEVVRCKDCKNRNSFFCPIEKESGTAHWFEDEDYCSFGERKENK